MNGKFSMLILLEPFHLIRIKIKFQWNLYFATLPPELKCFVGNCQDDKLAIYITFMQLGLLIFQYYAHKLGVECGRDEWYTERHPNLLLIFWTRKPHISLTSLKTKMCITLTFIHNKWRKWTAELKIRTLVNNAILNGNLR